MGLFGFVLKHWWRGSGSFKNLKKQPLFGSNIHKRKSLASMGLFGFVFSDAGLSPLERGLRISTLPAGVPVRIGRRSQHDSRSEAILIDEQFL